MEQFSDFLETIAQFFDSLDPVLRYSLFGISLKEFLVFLLFVVVARIVIPIVWNIVIIRVEALTKKTKVTWDDLFITFLKDLRPVLFLLAVLLGATALLPLPGLWEELFQKVAIIIIAFHVLNLAGRFIDFFAYRLSKKISKGAGEGFPVFRRLLKIALWILAILVLLSNFGFNVSSLIAGLGIGGIAIALAAQNVLSDIFASLSISIDQPFRVGDFIEVDGGVSGTVENIGIKTTRIRTINGEEVSLPNANLTSADIHNFARVQERRITIAIGVEYDTPQEKLKKIPQVLESVVAGVAETRFLRAHFVSYGDFSLNFELVLYSLSSGLSEKLIRQEEVLYKVFEAFAKEEISMAFPTQTIHMKKDSDMK